MKREMLFSHSGGGERTSRGVHERGKKMQSFDVAGRREGQEGL